MKTIRLKMTLNPGVILLILLTLLSCKNKAENTPPESGKTGGIIPMPLKTERMEGVFTIDENTVLVKNNVFQRAVEVVENALNSALISGANVQEKPNGKTNIIFVYDETLADKAYFLSITSVGIEIKAKTAVSAFYAAQSLKQMLWNISGEIMKESIELSCLTISDAPEYEWRGFHLDVSRHFFTKDYILEIIDWLAYYKLNKLHLHLTDDQGWRIQSDKFPLLNEVGSWRSFNNLDSACMEKAKTNPDFQIDERFIKIVNGKQVYGGFFTKQDIHEIVEYAAANFIDVIPEIDMPGHMSAAIAAYPTLSCTDSIGWGREFSYPLCPCREEVMTFCKDVWEEIIELFPYPTVHIGSDEVEKDTWETSADCQEFMNQHNMTNLNEIQNYFVTQMQLYLESKGKVVITWDDVIDGNVDENLIMMYWREWLPDSPERCAANGNKIILTPWDHFYLSGEHTDETLENLYLFNPEKVYSSAVNEKVTGLQSCVWTEEIPSEQRFEYLVFPRLQALSEVCWSSTRDWYSFQTRMEPHFLLMNHKNINYRHPDWKK